MVAFRVPLCHHRFLREDRGKEAIRRDPNLDSGETKMPDRSKRGSWAPPGIAALRGQYVTIARVDPEADIEDLYAVSHGTPEFERLWTYLWYGPFPDKSAMYQWLTSIQESRDPLFYTVFSLERQRKVGMLSILNIAPDMGRAELGHIWYSPLVQRSAVNTEATFLLLRYLFDELGYRRVEWKCDNENEASKRAALRMGFRAEGVFRKHMIVKGKNRDTAWFAMIDEDWPAIRANFEAYLSTPGLSLTEMNQRLITSA
jgi:RimJ/RimL family protein N-acetyltransferase